jgi:hypothetical protein
LKEDNIKETRYHQRQNSKLKLASNGANIVKNGSKTAMDMYYPEEMNKEF